MKKKEKLGWVTQWAESPGARLPQSGSFKKAQSLEPYIPGGHQPTPSARIPQFVGAVTAKMHVSMPIFNLPNNPNLL